MKKIIAGNWKMNGTSAVITELVTSLLQQEATAVEVVLFPPSPYLSHTKRLLAQVNWHLGAQNISQFDNGAYTGEVSGAMLRDLGCNYVLVGHSERRHVFLEDDVCVARKFSKAVLHKIVPFLCIGETVSERDTQQTLKVIDRQLQSVLDLPKGAELLANAVIAYEPVWAIGSGQSASVKDAVVVHAHIKEQLSAYGISNIPVLYGGSVNELNAAEFLECEEVDGLLVGGASLDANKFMEIMKCIK